MKIVIDARESGTSTGRYVDKLIENLQALKPKHEIIVLTKPGRLAYMREAAPSFKVVKSPYKEFTFGEQLGLLRQIRRLKPDLVHFTMPQQPVMYSGRAVTTFHDLTTLRFRNPTKNRLIFGVKQKIYGRVLLRVAKKSVAILTISEHTKQDLVRYAGVAADKITVAYLAADKITAPAEAIQRLAGKQFIMYVGRAHPHKNLERLFAAFKLLRQEHPDLILVLAGKTDASYRRLAAKVTAQRMADAVWFTDYVTEGQLRWLYLNATAYVFPSLSEGFGLPGLEAMAHGTPVVSSDATCLPEIYGQAAVYFNPKSAKDMALKIHKVLASPNLRSELAARGRTQAARYSWRRLAEQTLAVYEKSLNQ